MPSEATPSNMFTHGPLGSIFAKTALPIIFVMGMNGLLSVVDALFLGTFVGADALSAVTLMFPLYMLMVALASLVASGMSSLLARHLGAQRFDEARAAFAGAHGLALVVSIVFVILFLAFGKQVALLAAAGSEQLADMGQTYIGILSMCSPVLFVLSVNSDALRNEGRAGLMAAMSLLVSLSNIGFNYVLIALMGFGVAGSAWGTVLAQVLALAIISGFRLRGRTQLRLGALFEHGLSYQWRSITALGAPQSLNFLGLSLGSAAILAALQLSGSPHYDTTVSAYGIITRIMTFAFLPLLGMSQALQSIIGNNFGAALWSRSDGGLRLGLGLALFYGLCVEIVLIAFAQPIGQAFVSDQAVVSEVGRIMPVMVAMFFLTGPLIMIATYFQAIGDAGRAAILGLSKPYLFAIPLTFTLVLLAGEPGIWFAGPGAELALLALTLIVLTQTAQSRQMRWGLFKATARGVEI